LYLNLKRVLSSVGLEHLSYKQDVAGSNLAELTIKYFLIKISEHLLPQDNQKKQSLSSVTLFTLYFITQVQKKTPPKLV
jgi:hypothetical protein